MPVIITNDFPPQSGGIQRVMSRIAQELAARGSDVVVVAPRDAGAHAFDATLPYRVARYRVFKQRFVGMLAMIPTYVWALRLARDRVTVASVWWPSAVAACLVPRLLRGRFAIFAHASEIAPNRAGLRRTIMRYVYSRADAVIAVSSVAENLLSDAEVTAKVCRVQLAVDATPIKPNRGDSQVILSVGRLIERKGFDRTIEALALVADEFPALRYSIIGAGPQMEELKALAQRRGVSNRVSFLGNVDETALQAAYAGACLFVLPTRRVGDDVEGFGLVYLEAAMAELPSIGGLRTGAVDAIVDGETGVLVDGDDPAQIAQGLRRLLRDPATTALMGCRALARAKTFTWERTATQLLAALDA